MSKTLTFQVQPTIFSNHPESNSIGSGPMFAVLDYWYLRDNYNKKYGVIPISAVIPRQEFGTPDDEMHRTSDRVLITKVLLSFWISCEAPVRFVCFAFRHNQQLANPLYIPTRPYDESHMYFGRWRNSQAIRRWLFHTMDENEVEHVRGNKIMHIVNPSVAQQVEVGVGTVSAFINHEPLASGSKFDHTFPSRGSSKPVRTDISIELDQEIDYASGMTYSGQPLELFVGLDPQGTNPEMVGVEVPISVSVEFKCIQNNGFVRIAKH